MLSRWWWFLFIFEYLFVSNTLPWGKKGSLFQTEWEYVTVWSIAPPSTLSAMRNQSCVLIYPKILLTVWDPAFPLKSVIRYDKLILVVVLLCMNLYQVNLSEPSIVSRVSGRLRWQQPTSHRSCLIHPKWVVQKHVTETDLKGAVWVF